MRDLEDWMSMEARLEYDLPGERPYLGFDGNGLL